MQALLSACELHELQSHIGKDVVITAVFPHPPAVLSRYNM